MRYAAMLLGVQYSKIRGVADGCDGDRAYGITIYARWQDDPSYGWPVAELPRRAELSSARS